MTTYLFSTLTAGAERVAQTDPHGWTLTLISIGVVFVALIILYFVYNFSGNIFSGKYRRKPKAAKEDAGEIAVAIAMALAAERGGDEEAAIAVALHLYLSDAVHDVEPGFITIRRGAPCRDNLEINFRKSPR